MKMVNKLLTGGIVPLHYTHVTAPRRPVAAPQAATESSNEGEELLSDNMKKLITEEALPSDAEQFIYNSSAFGRALLSPSYGVQNSPGDAKELLLYLNKMKHEKSMFFENIKHIDTIGGKGEAAISDNGGVFVLRNGKIQVVRVKDMRKGELALTNQLIASIRSQDSRFAFNSSLTSALGNATSMVKIKEVIDKNLNAMELNKTTEMDVASGRGAEESVISGFRAMNITLQDLMQMDTHTLIKRTTTSVSNEKLLQNALNSIYYLLDSNMKVLLDLRAKLLSDATGSKITSSELLLEYVSSRAKNELSVTLDIDTSGSKAKRDNSNSPKLTLAGIELAGLAPTLRITLNPGTHAEINVLATVGTLVDNSGSRLGLLSLAAIHTTQQKPAINTTLATFAGVKLNEAQFLNIMLKGSLYYIMDLPFDQNALATTGVAMPDLDLCRKVDAIEYQIKQSGITDVATINAMYEKAGLPVKYVGVNSLGLPQLNIQAYRKFAAFNVIADGKGMPSNVDMDDYSKYFKYVSDKSVIETFKNVLIKENKEFSPSTNMFTNNDIYEGVVYMPIMDGSMVSLLSNPTADNAINVDKMSKFDYRSLVTSQVYNAGDPLKVGLNYK